MLREKPTLTFYRQNGAKCEVGEAARVLIQRHVQHDDSAAEAGGVLLGRLVSGTTDVVIDFATEPSQTDRRGRFFFFRQKHHAQQKVNAAWERSRGAIIYLGEWHTHPEDDPTPSQIDLKNWKRIAKSASFEQDFLLFLIAGRGICRLWEVSATDGCAVRLRSGPADSTP
jgi:integrative and conjugative element protein (TIGR02256 family)